MSAGSGMQIRKKFMGIHNNAHCLPATLGNLHKGYFSFLWTILQWVTIDLKLLVEGIESVAKGYP
jgi:hypothetical protein